MSHELTPGTLLLDEIEVLSRIGGDEQEGRYLAKRIEHRGHVLVHALYAPIGNGPDLGLQALEQAADVVHPSLPERIGCGRANDNTIFLAEDYPSGELLSSLLLKTVSSASDLQIAGRTCQLLSAIAAAHEQGVFHGRLRPGSVLIEQPEGGGEQIRVLGFGVQQARSAAGLRVIPGGSGFCPPEVVAGDAGGGLHNDLYGAGAMVLAMVAGTRTVEAVAEGRVIAKTARISAFGPLIKRALAEDPGDRYENAEAMMSAAEQLVRKLKRKEASKGGTVDEHVGFDSALSSVVGAATAPEEDDEEAPSALDADWMSLLPEHSGAPGRHSTLAALEAELAFSGADESDFDEILSRASGDDAKTKVTGPPPNMRAKQGELSGEPPLPPENEEVIVTFDEGEVEDNETTTPGRPAARARKPRPERTNAATPAAKMLGEREEADASADTEAVSTPSAADEVTEDAEAEVVPPKEVTRREPLPKEGSAGASGTAVRRRPTIENPPPPPSASSEADNDAGASATDSDASGTDDPDSSSEDAANKPAREDTAVRSRPKPAGDDEEDDVDEKEASSQGSGETETGVEPVVPVGIPVGRALIKDESGSGDDARLESATDSESELASDTVVEAVGETTGETKGDQASDDADDIQQLDTHSGEVEVVDDDELDTDEGLDKPPPPPKDGPLPSGTFEVMGDMDEEPPDEEEDEDELELNDRDPEPLNEVEVRTWILKSAIENGDVIPSNEPRGDDDTRFPWHIAAMMAAAAVLVVVLLLSAGEEDVAGEDNGTSVASAEGAEESESVEGEESETVSDEDSEEMAASADEATDQDDSDAPDMSEVRGLSTSVAGQLMGTVGAGLGLVATNVDPVVPDDELPLVDSDLGVATSTVEEDAAKREERRKRREERRKRREAKKKAEEEAGKDPNSGFLDVKVD